MGAYLLDTVHKSERSLRRRLWLVVLAMTGMSLTALGQATTPTATPSPKEGATESKSQDTSTVVSAAATTPTPTSASGTTNTGKTIPDQTAGSKPAMTSDQFMATVGTALVACLKKLTEKEPKDSSEVLVAVIALAGVALSALISYLVSAKAIKAAKAADVFKAHQEMAKARVDTALAYTSKMLELQYGQLENFYAPLLARTQQCRGIQDKLTLYLYNQSMDIRFRWRDVDAGEKRLQVKVDQEWADFRLLDQLPTIAADKVAMALVDQILVIDGEMEDIIRKHNGLASVDKQISPVYGRFLAHVTILRLERERLRDPQCQKTAHEPGFHGDAYYPRELDKLITQEYDAVREAVKKFKSMSDKALIWLDEIKIGKT